jgi:hypothetical protein
MSTRKIKIVTTDGIKLRLKLNTIRYVLNNVVRGSREMYAVTAESANAVREALGSCSMSHAKH